MPSLIFCALVAAVFASSVSAQNVSVSLAADHMSREVCRSVARCLKKLDKNEQCEILPVPKGSFVANVPAGSFKLTLLRDGVWVYDDGGYLSLILKMGTRLALLDFPDSSASRVIEAAEQVLDGTVPNRIDMVYSHGHYDHIGGATRFLNFVKAKYPSAHILIWGTEETRMVIEKSASKRAVKPNVIVGGVGRTLSLGPGLDFKMQIVGGHTATDLLLYIPKYREQASVVMFVDVVFPGWSPFLNLAITEDFSGFLAAHEELLKLDFDFFIGGHARIGNRRDVVRNQRYTKNLAKAGAKAIQTVSNEDLLAGGLGKVGDPTAPEFGNIWFAFIEVARKLQIDVCYRIMLKKWGCKLAGLDITLRSHCFISVTYNLVEA